ncbi:MAG: tetratricopeptide repeat protein [Polyangiaceae bacterium]
MLRRLLALLVVLLTLGLSTARADDAAATFAEGRELYDAKRYDEALPKFQTAVAASQSPNARLYLARCLREMGRLAEAHHELSRTVADARDKATDDPYYAQTRDAAATELAVLDGRVGKIVVILDDELRGAEVRVNDAPLASDRLGLPVAVLPGDVVIRAENGDERGERRLEIAAGETRSVTLEPSAAAVGAAEAPSRTPIATEAPDESDDEGAGFGVVRAIGIGVATLGAAGLVTFGVMTAQADDKLATLEEECGGVRCTDPQYADVVDDGKRAETIAVVSAVAGGALLAGGIAMIIFGGPSEDEPVAAQLSVSPLGGYAGLRLRF